MSARKLANADCLSGNKSDNKKFNRTPPNTLLEKYITISNIVYDSVNNKGAHVERRVIDCVTERQLEDLINKGLDIDERFIHSIDTSAIQHNQNTHGNEIKESKKKQIAVQAGDYLRIIDIIRNYDYVMVSKDKSKKGLQVIIYQKKYKDGTVYYLEEIRTGRMSLAFDTMYIKRIK